MLAYFTIDQTLLGEFDHAQWKSNGSYRRSLVLNHERLIERWRSAGVLVHDAASFDQSKLASLINELPQDVRIRWKKAFRQLALRSLSEGVSWSGFASLFSPDIDARSQNVPPDLDVVLLDDEYASLVFDIPEDENSEHKEFAAGPDVNRLVELCRFSAVDRSITFSAAEALMRAVTLFEGRPLQDLWSEYFQHQCRHARSIVLLDRYGCKDGDGDGLQRVLHNVDASADLNPDRTVTIILGYRSDDERDRVSSYIVNLKKNLNRRGIARILLFLAKDSCFQRLSHGRFMRFEDHVMVTDLGVGLFSSDSRGRPRLNKNAQLSISCSPDTFKKIECEIKSESEKDGYPEEI